VSCRKYGHAVEDLRVGVVDLNDRNQKYWGELQNLATSSGGAYSGWRREFKAEAMM